MGTSIAVPKHHGTVPGPGCGWVDVGWVGWWGLGEGECGDPRVGRGEVGVWCTLFQEGCGRLDHTCHVVQGVAVLNAVAGVPGPEVQ